MWHSRPRLCSQACTAEGGCASASESVRVSRGASPLRANVLRPVTKSNCVAARPGGEQQEVKVQSVTQVNSIRPDGPGSLLTSDELQTRVLCGKPVALKGNVTKRRRGPSGGWSRN